MNDWDKAIIREFAENDMKPTLVADYFGIHRNTVLYHLNKIWEETELNPRCFYDLCELLRMVNSECTTSHLLNNE